MICNHIGIEWMIGNMTWNGERGFVTNKAQNWFTQDEPAGIFITERNLTYVRIYNSSHMVGADNPMAMLDILTRFTNASTDDIQFKTRLEEINLAQDSLPSTVIEKKPTNHYFLVAVVLVAVALIVGLIWWKRKILAEWWSKRQKSQKGMMPISNSSTTTIDNPEQEHELDSLEHRDAQFTLYDQNDFADETDSDSEFERSLRPDQQHGT